MKTIPDLKNRIFAFLLIAGIIAYGFFELLAHQKLAYQQSDDALQSVQSAESRFNEFQNEFIHENEILTQSTIQALQKNENLSKLIGDKAHSFNFWGISVFRDTTLLAWSGFAAESLSIPDSNKIDAANPLVDIKQENNVTYLSYRSSFSISKDSLPNKYSIITRAKLQQSNTLSIAEDANLNASALFQSDNQFPVHFSFVANIPNEAQHTRALSTPSEDSAGFVYSVPSDSTTYLANRENRILLFRAIFYALIILLAALFLITYAQRLDKWKALLVKLLAITFAWLFFSLFDYSIGWIQLIAPFGESGFSNIKPLFDYGLHALFLSLTAYTFFSPILTTNFKEIGHQKSILTVLLILFGLLNSFLIYFFFIETYQIVYQTNILVLDLEILPGWQTFTMYLSSGIWVIAAVVLLTLLGWFLLKLSRHPVLVTTLFMILGYLLGAFIIFALSLYIQIAFWIIISAGLFFGVILISSILANLKPEWLSEASRLRFFLLVCFFATSFSHIATFKGYSDRLNKQMKEASQLFQNDEESEAENIARTLLVNLEESISGLNTNEITERPAFVENFFIQNNRKVITESWDNFSISTQLIDNEGNVIAEYSTDLDTPAWTRSFNIRSLLIPFEEEQIRITNLRPIIRERPLNEANSNYSVFRRAWIPFFDNSDTAKRIGWILCSVYREKPQFEKPLRAVIASGNSQNWNTSISLTEYENGRSARRTIAGLPLDLPGYIQLNDELSKQIQEEENFQRITVLGDQKIREYFTAVSENQIIRAAANQPGFNNHLFSLLRLYFSLLIPGLILLGLLRRNKQSILLKQNNRFRDRLIDRFILASLICLIALIGTTYYAIKNQNQKSIEDELLIKLENLAEEFTAQETIDESGDFSFNQFTSNLDADATLYVNKKVASSTTTQIFNQHLLPQLLPWQVFQSIYEAGNRQITQRLTLGNQNLLVGYQPWIGENGEITGVVSIPTFLEAPKFKEQLLSTTSYLLIVYAIIFGIFILAASFISTQLTSPLNTLQAGLKKISGGDLETRIPVKSDDEIGALTRAYNVMVGRLKGLQEELVKAEREAAWKEMAQQVAHEIKNPLTPMKLNLQHLQRQLNISDQEFATLRPQIENIVSNMIGQIESLNRIASDFSKFARPIEEEFKIISIHKILAEVADLYQSDKKLKIFREFDAQEIQVSGVGDELSRAFINLMKNSIEAMPDGGTITITTSFHSEDQLAIITIADSGIGIPQKMHQQIFVPNFSTKSSGTGLGLAITKKIIQEHGGEIAFTSEVGKGTSFYIELPIVEK